MKVQARFDQPPGVLGHVEEDKRFFVADPVVHGAGGLGGFGGVLGDVGGDGLFGEVFAVAERADGLHVELRAPPQRPPLRDPGFRNGRHNHFDPGGGGADRVVEKVVGGPGRGRGVGAFGSVEADDRVEVDGSALLVLGDLPEGHLGLFAGGFLGESGSLGDFAAEVDREVAPEVGGVVVPQHRPRVVVGVRVERCAEFRGVLAVPGSAAAGAVAGPVVDRAERGGRQGGEDPGVIPDRGRGAFVGVAGESGADEVVGVSGVGPGAGGAAGGAAVAAGDP